MSRRRTYSGSEADISFEGRRCIHAERCVHGLPGVFDPDSRPWINPDGGSAEGIAAVVGRCPTGAISMIRHDGGPEEIADDRVSISVVPDGPLHARGALSVGLPGETEKLEEKRAAFCRCGRSANKPFCDNAHLDAPFVAGDLETMPERAVPDAPDPGGAAVSPLENGPLFFEGVVQFTSADGVVGWIKNPALCRCGLSGTKPFCDGSHKDGGFVAPGPAKGGAANA